MKEPIEGNVSWSFPEINQHAYPFSESTINSHSANRDIISEDAFNKLIAENNRLVAELNELNNKNRTQMQLVDDILKKFTDSSQYINDEIIAVIKYCIKAVTEKIIRQNYQENFPLLDQLINALRSHIDYHSGPIAIYVAEQDFQTLSKNNHPLISLIKSDKSLASGDMIMRSQYTEIRSLVVESIDKLLG